MAKYGRHDTRNKKRNKHKQFAKEGFKGKLHNVERKQRIAQKHNLSVHGAER